MKKDKKAHKRDCFLFTHDTYEVKQAWNKKSHQEQR